MGSTTFGVGKSEEVELFGLEFSLGLSGEISFSSGSLEPEVNIVAGAGVSGYGLSAGGGLTDTIYDSDGIHLPMLDLSAPEFSPEIGLDLGLFSLTSDPSNDLNNFTVILRVHEYPKRSLTF